MDRSEFWFRAGQCALVVGGLIFLAAQFAPFTLEKRQGVSFGLLAAIALRYAYLLIRDGWEAVESAANGEGRFMLVTLIVCALIATPY